MKTVTITLNGVEVSGYEGMTILDMAKEVGIDIPTLCHDPHLTNVGACRICLVENEKNGVLLASCVTPISPGMVINTKSPKVMETRKTIVELMLASHPDSCVVCDEGNRCQLRKIASDLGVGLMEFERLRSPLPIKEVNPFIQRDLSKCILCGKCVRACQELEVIGAIDYAFRGYESIPSTLNEKPLEESECTFCGTCVTLCPVGALSEREKKFRGSGTTTMDTICSFCGCGCNLYLETKEDEVIGAGPGDNNSFNGISLCVRGHYGYDYIHSPKRLRMPLIKKDGDFLEIPWDEALEFAAKKLDEIKRKYGGESIALLGTSKCTNEEAYLLQKFARGVLGTNNIDNVNSLSLFPSFNALCKAFGYGAATISLRAIEESPTILLIGANLTSSHPLIGQKVKGQVRRGAKLILIDPGNIPLGRFAYKRFMPKPDTDLCLINGLINIIIREELWDKDFVDKRVFGFEEFKKSVEEFTPERVSKITGIKPENIIEVARLLANEKALILYGEVISKNSDNVQSLINLALLTGSLRGKGVGLIPLIKENNGQGACDMGVLPHFLPGGNDFNDPEAKRVFEENWQVKLPERMGLTVLEMLASAKQGKVKAMYIVGANPLSTLPDPDMVKESLDSLEFLVVQDMFMNETASMADIVLPAASFAEKDGSFTSLERRVQRIKKVIKPLGESRPDWMIISELAKRMGYPMDYPSPRAIMEEISLLLPSYRGIKYEGMEEGGHFWPCEDIDDSGTQSLYEDGFVKGSGRLIPVRFREIDDSSYEYPFWLIKGSDLYHFGNGTRTLNSSRLKSILPRGSLAINPSDAGGLNLTDGDNVKVSSRRGGIEVQIKITEDMPRGILFVPKFLTGSNILNNKVKIERV